MGSERRRHPRLTLFAQVQLTREDEVHVMSARNVSLGGLFVDAEPEEAPELIVGRTVEVVLFAPEDAEAAEAAEATSEQPEDVVGSARIVRAEATSARSGFGLQFTRLDPQNMRRLAQLLKRLS
ncbi:MAG: PilZ domain-containing protein [Myxococcales bacterium]|nr:PilZ domain-containing protein [Myxococcales bacterium]